MAKSVNFFWVEKEPSSGNNVARQATENIAEIAWDEKETMGMGAHNHFDPFFLHSCGSCFEYGAVGKNGLVCGCWISLTKHSGFFSSL